MDIGKVLPFAVGEYRERVQRVQHEMAALDLDAMLCHTFSSICFLTGFETVAWHKYFVLIIPREGEPTLVGQMFELYNAWTSAWIEDCVGHDLMADPIEVTRRVVLERGLGSVRLGIEHMSPDLHSTTYDRLRDALPNAAWVDASGLIERVKVVKSAAEIASIRRAAYLSDLGMRAALATVAAGRSDNDVAAAAYGQIISNGGEYMCLDPIVTVGQRSGLPHSTHRRVSMQPGDTVLIEIGACVDRYSAPIMRTASIEPPSDEVLRAAETCRAANDTIIAHIRPGICANEVALAAEHIVAESTRRLVWHGYYAYSIGLGFPPRWDDTPFCIRATVEDVLQEGMVFHASVSLRDPGRFGVAFSETIVVTGDGCEVLTNVPRDLVIA